jgi:hypothetical protein
VAKPPITESPGVDGRSHRVSEMAQSESGVVLPCRPHETFATPPRHIHSNDQDEPITHWHSRAVPWDATDKAT